MSDIPPPPGATPTPPPPPPNLTPPPGYAAYAPSYVSSVALKRVGGLTTWIVVLTAIVAVVGVVSSALSRLATDEAREFLADQSNEFLEQDFLEAYAPSLLFAFVQGAATIAIMVLTMIWMYRLASNHRALQRNGTWAPGWAIGGWFLPPGGLYIIPYLMFRELWKASDPAVPAGDERWKQNRVGIVVTVWWVLYGLAPIPLAIAQGLTDIGARRFSGDNEVAAETVDERFAISFVTSLVAAAAAVAYIVMVRQLSGRHRQLTGEAAQPT